MAARVRNAWLSAKAVVKAISIGQGDRVAGVGTGDNVGDMEKPESIDENAAESSAAENKAAENNAAQNATVAKDATGSGNSRPSRAARTARASSGASAELSAAAFTPACFSAST